MRPIFRLRAGVFVVVCLGLAAGAWARDAQAAVCPAGFNAQHGVNVRGDEPLNPPIDQGARGCAARVANGSPVPDPGCTPGAVNPTVTEEVLRAPGFTTKCLRDKATTAKRKDATYDWYGVTKPANNTGRSMVCEKDHVIPLVLGGADTLDNIWPQCGPPGVELRERHFKRKDAVECYLADRVRNGAMSLKDAQRGIAEDWTQFLADAEAGGGSCSGD